MDDSLDASSAVRVVVLGASGRCGQWLVRIATERGHRVTAVVRPGSRCDLPERATVQRGQVLDHQFLAEVIPDHDVVVSCLGQRRRGISPWSAILSPPNLVSQVTRHATGVMEEGRVRRFIFISAGGVGSSLGQSSFAVRRLINRGNLRVAYADLAHAEQHVAATGLDWHAVRPVTLVQGEPTSGARCVQRYRLLSTVRRSDVALWMVRWIEGKVGGPDRTPLLGR